MRLLRSSIDKKQDYYNGIVSGSSIDELLEYNIRLLERLAECPITIIFEGRQYGNKGRTQALELSNGMENLSTFKWHGCLCFVITGGIILFWAQYSKLREDSIVFESAARQIDLTINNFLLTRKLMEIATIDELTKLYNRRHFMSVFEDKLMYLSRYGGCIGFILMDIDNFKSYNDTYGHPEGDILLSNLGSLLNRVTRKTDVVGRLGGEEFGVIVPVDKVEALYIIANKIRGHIADELNEGKGTALRQVTVSIGTSLYGKDGKKSGELYRTADERLYIAKEQGRNRVIVK